MCSDNTAEDTYKTVLQPLLEELKLKVYSFPKTIVYTKLKLCGFAYEFFSQNLADSDDADISMISQYHAPCKEEVSI